MRRLVLMVERNEEFASELKKILRPQGFKIQIVYSVENVHLYFLMHPFCAIFLDIETDPLFIKLLRNIVPNTKIILTSKNYLNKGLLKRAMDHGAYGCVHKPFVESEVLAMLPASGKKRE